MSEKMSPAEATMRQPQKNGERLQRFFDKTHFNEVRKDEASFTDLLERMEFADFKRYLIHLNGLLRQAPKAERGFYQKDMFFSSLVAPSNEIQERVLEKGFQAIKTIPDQKARAALAYYLINDLHIFLDGNGRTSRFLYELLNNPDVDFSHNYQKFAHDDRDSSFPEGKNFTDKVDIAKIDQVNNYAGYGVVSDLQKDGRILDHPQINGKGLQTMVDVPIEGARDFNNVFLTSAAQENLTPEQKKLVGRALQDNNVSYTVSGTTMAIMTTEKGSIGDCISQNEQAIAEGIKKFGENSMTYRKSLLIFDLDKDSEEAAKIFANWTAADYLRAVEIADEVKEAQLDKIIAFFQKAEDFMVEPGVTLADKLLKREKGKSAQDALAKQTAGLETGV